MIPECISSGRGWEQAATASECTIVPVQSLGTWGLLAHLFSEIAVVKRSVFSKFCASSEGGEALAQVAQRSCGFPLPGSVQGQVGWSSLV